MMVDGKKGSVYSQDVLSKDLSLILLPVYVTCVLIQKKNNNHIFYAMQMQVNFINETLISTRRKQKGFQVHKHATANIKCN
jgi:hypothetical protein